MNTVYLDHNSTTALRQEVLEVMIPWLTGQHGNPTSRHVLGRNARDAIESARQQVANAVGVKPAQVVFTASGTEANNFALRGITAGLSPTQVLYSAIEHPCVSRPAESLRAIGWDVASIPVNTDGELLLEPLKELLKKPTGLISVMTANNETGAIQPISQVSDLARYHGALVHTDAVQALGKIPLDFHALGVHAMTISSHKIGGPIGAGALILDKRVDIHPILLGGGQERGLRSGTENIAAIVGFGHACTWATETLAISAPHNKALITSLEHGLNQLGAKIFAQHATRLPNTCFFAFDNIDGETLVTAMDKLGFAIASGSACSSDSSDPSHVLLSMGIEADTAKGAVRVSVSQNNQQEEIERFLKALKTAIENLKGLAAIAA